MRTRSHRISLLAACVLVLSLTVAAALVVPSARADHNTEPWGAGTVVTGVGTMPNYTATTLDDGHGNLFVFRLWQQPGGLNLYVYKYQDVGAHATPVLESGFPVQVNGIANVVTYLYGYPTVYASAAIDNAGNVYLAWTHANTGPSFTDVYVSRSTDGGKTWALTTQVSSTKASEYDQWPAILAAPSGTLYVAWVQDIAGWYNVTVATSTNQANSWTTQQNVSDRSSNGASVDSIKLAVDSLGRIYLVYDREAPSRSFVNLTWTDGSTWTAPVNLNSGTTADGLGPAIAVDYANRIHVAWEDSRTAFNGNAEIFYVSSSDRGATWTPQVPVSQGLALMAGSWDIQIATKGDNILMTWDIYGTGAPDGFDQSYVISADHGGSWYPEAVKTWGAQSFGSFLTVDQNGTFYLGTTIYATTELVEFNWWHSPPSTPVMTSVVSGTGSLTLSWNAPFEADINAYRVLRSLDGTTYTVAATVAGSARSYTDTGLANGTYWYRLEAVDTLGYVSHDSQPLSDVVGLSTAQLIANLQSEIASLQAQLASANTSSAAAIAAAQAQITSLQNQLTNLQNSQATNNAATAAELARLEANLTAVQNQLNNLQGQQATQTISYANLAFEVIVVVLLVVLLLNQMRKPKAPQMMMAEPAQSPKKPEDEL